VGNWVLGAECEPWRGVRRGPPAHTHTQGTRHSEKSAHGWRVASACAVWASGGARGERVLRDLLAQHRKIVAAVECDGGGVVRAQRVQSAVPAEHLQRMHTQCSCRQIKPCQLDACQERLQQRAHTQGVQRSSLVTVRRAHSMRWGRRVRALCGCESREGERTMLCGVM
jgi:hypothetical protein